MSRFKRTAELEWLCGRAESVVEFSPRYPAEFSSPGKAFDPLGEGEFASAFRQDAYLNASLAMLGQSDILIAIWNGAPQTAPGSTYDTMLRALGDGVPVCVVDPRADRPVRIISCLEDLYGNGSSLTTIAEAIAAKWGVSGTRLESELALVREDLTQNTRKALPPLANVWNWFQNLVARKKLQSVDGGPYREETRSDYLIFDRMANNYGSRYRSSFLGLALMSLLAVFFAAVTCFAPAGEWRHPVLLVFAVGEVGFLVGSILNMRRAIKSGWLEKLTTFRYIAEVLRCNTITAALGTACPYKMADDSLYGSDSQVAWSTYFLRNAIRAFGVESIKKLSSLGMDFANPME